MRNLPDNIKTYFYENIHLAVIYQRDFNQLR
jgi:hypothetical protein